MNTQNKTETEETKKLAEDGTESKSRSNSTSSSKSNSASSENSNQKSEEKNDLQKQVSDLAATGASIAIKKAVDASLGSMAGNNHGSGGGQMDSVQWRKLAVWIAISGVAIGVAKFLSSDMVDQLITEYLEE